MKPVIPYILLFILTCCSFIEAAQENPFTRFLGKPYGSYHYAIRDSLRKRYDSGDATFVAITIKQLRQLPDRLGDRQWQLEADFLEANYIHDYQQGDRDFFVQQLHHMQDISKKHNNKVFEVRIVRRLFDLEKMDHPEIAIEYARELEQLLEMVDTESYPDLIDCKFRLANMYLDYQHYEQAERYYKMVVAMPVEDNIQPIFVHARNNLSIIQRRYYGNLDSADYWLYSIQEFDKTYTIREHPTEWKAIVAGNLGQNQLARHQYNEALPLLLQAYNTMFTLRDYDYAYSMATHISNCYCQLQQFEQAWQFIEAAALCLNRRPTLSAERLYKAKNIYFTGKGNTRQAAIYLDSAFFAQQQALNQKNPTAFLTAEQQLNREEMEESRLKGKQHYNRFVVSACFAGLFCILMLFIWWLYLKKQRQYRDLIHKTRQWALYNQPYREAFPERIQTALQCSISKTTPNASEEDETKLLEKVSLYLEESRCYIDPSLTLEDLVRYFGVNRTYLSAAINRSEVSFKRFINQYRIKAAIQLIHEQPDSQLEDIYLQVGFNNRRTFYNAFKETTGISPSQFKNDISA